MSFPKDSRTGNPPRRVQNLQKAVRKIDEITLSYSRISSYLTCPQKHHFSYIEGITPKGVVRPLAFGSDFHKLLQYRTSPEKLAEIRKEIQGTYYELPSNQQSKLGEDYIDQLFEIFEDYEQIWANAEKPVETEHEFKVHVANYKGIPVYFHGIIDEIYKDGSIGEHKTFTNAPDLSILTMNMQSMLYAKALELERGKLPPKIRWDYIKSRVADFPIWLEKSKRFSAASSSKITPMSYLRACKQRGITDPEVLGKASEYQQNIPNFFFRHEVDVLPDMVETVWNGFMFTVKDILLRSEKNTVKNITRDCSWCNFRPICYAQFTGADVEYVKEQDYQKRK